MNRQLALQTLLLVAAWGLIPGTVRAQVDGPISAEQVRESIRRGVQYLLGEQSPQGQWNDIPGNPGGVTALCTLALLNSGVEPSDPHIQKSLKYLRGLEPKKTYCVALRIMVFSAAEPRRDLMLIQRHAQWLEDTQMAGGGWSYPGSVEDNSNSQFAVLALHEAERAGAVVRESTWESAAAYWRKCQVADGSWGYQQGYQSGTGSMTCAGIGATVICSLRTSGHDALVDDGLVTCCRPQDENERLQDAINWLRKNFSVGRNPASSLWHYYYLYGLERVGRLTARRFIGDHDWYREGAELLVSQQDQFSHRWIGTSNDDRNPHIGTAYALLFLSKGRRPVLIGKVDHTPDNDWNNHRNDVANITAAAEKRWGLDMTWQVIDPREASVEDLLQVPVLFVSGSKDPGLDPYAERVRAYLDRGGFLLAEACCVEHSGFEQGFRRFLDRVFPEGEYKLRRAGPEHPIWRVEQPVRPESPYAGRLWTVEYGCRTCVVFSEIDLSCYWELAGLGGETPVELADVVQGRIDDAVAVGLNVLAYATNREPRGKEASFATAGSLAELTGLGGRGVIQIAKLQHGGGCNDAPGALANLLRTAAQGDLRLAVDLSEYPVLPSDKNLLRFHMAFMHGRQNFHFTPAEREQLAEYLTNGGTLFADSICGSKPFAAAFRREMAEVLPNAHMARVPVSHPLFSEAAGGFDIHRVKRREPAHAQPGEPLRARVREGEPELEGIEIGGRLAVIFSPYDISCALEQHESLQCPGYTREDAARIALNVLMYSLSPDVAAGE